MRNSDWKTESSENESPGPSKPRRKKSRKKRRHEETTVNWNGNNTRTLIGAIKRDKVGSCYKPVSISGQFLHENQLSGFFSRNDDRWPRSDFPTITVLEKKKHDFLMKSYL